MEWLRPLLMMFYAPARALRLARDRAPLAPALLLALLSQLLYAYFIQWLYLRQAFRFPGPRVFLMSLVQSAGSLLLVAVILVPVIIMMANLFERRGSLGLVIRQEYAAMAATAFYALAAANLIAIPLALFANLSGVQAAYVENAMRSAGQFQSLLPAEMQQQLVNPRFHAENLFRSIKLFFFVCWAVVAVREVFRLTIWRALLVMLTSIIVIFITSPVWAFLFGTIFASPFLLLLLFFLLRGYIGEVSRGQRARASFKQNLEAATLNPADASAHYNLGLIHQQRGELDAARQRFERAIEIDPEELDAHYQLGRIARAENRLPDAIQHFEQVVAHDRTHAQHEIWREIGATYLAAGQYGDARDVLENFLEQRQSDPEGLYLMGRAHAGLGHRREAAASMQACIEAVRTAPAYKYRTEKRWLN
ncbi:MAG TPA: tetratricopeptide repeat protein, partial [Pyrinomonadaceae bacterium]